MSINDFLGFNPESTESADSFEGRQEPLPEGDYEVVASEAVKEKTKDGQGWFWKLVFKVINGDYEGREIVHRFNICNKSEAAERIGRSQMKRFLECIGNLRPENEDAMTGIPFFVSVKCKKASFLGRDGKVVDTINNEVTKMNPINEATAAAKETAATEDGADKSAPPWKRKESA